MLSTLIIRPLAELKSATVLLWPGRLSLSYDIIRWMISYCLLIWKNTFKCMSRQSACMVAVWLLISGRIRSKTTAERVIWMGSLMVKIPTEVLSQRHNLGLHGPWREGLLVGVVAQHWQLKPGPWFDSLQYPFLWFLCCLNLVRTVLAHADCTFDNRHKL